MIDIFVTYPTKKQAQKICGMLLKQRQAACVNFFPVESWYYWQGRLKKNREYASLIKTHRRHFIAITRYIKQHHPDAVPCIFELPVGRVYPPYQQWLLKQTRLP
ncbi:MAG: divalent-cation tolerance protein CutA [Patescibacteria group bacterium]